MRKVCILLLLAFALSACGQKGALYLPDQEPKKERLKR
jgi:predicted small lipoprotein YifL